MIAMEALSKLLDRVVDGLFIEGFFVASRDSFPLTVSQLLFADNILIFCGVDPDQLLHLKCAMLCFEAVSGLRINLGKSELVPVGSVPEVVGLALILGCMVSGLPMKYLGPPLGAKFKPIEVWDPILEKMVIWLLCWYKIHIYLRGKAYYD